MKFRFIILICCIHLHSVAIGAQTLSEELVFEERVFDFGEINEKDGLVSHEFKFKNVSRKIVSINGVTSGCGCVQFEFPREPLRPNATGKVKVTYNPAYRPGFFSKEAVVLSNNNTNYNRIWVKGTVIPCRHPVSENYPYEYGSGLWMNLEVMAFGTIGKGGTKTMKLKYVNDTDKDIQLMFVVVGGNTDIRFTSPHRVKAREEGVMPVNYQYSGKFPTETRVYPVVDGQVLKKPLRITCIAPVTLSVDERVKDLLSRMTLKEKVGQLLCPLGWEMYEIRGDEVYPSEKFKKLIKEKNAGMLWATYRADPWTKKTLKNGLNPELAAKAGNALQKYVIENTRLGIPMFLAEEAPHGHMAIGATVFPTGIGMAATWSPPLIEEVGKAISKEIRSQGAHISYGPVLDLSRDPRWSRVEETFGEDPVLSARLGAAMVTGLGSGDLSREYSTIATLKHFLAYAMPEGGQNGNYASVGTRDLHENFLLPFQEAIDAGALSVMTSYNSIDGIPCTANYYLLTQLLRNEWKFHGFVVSDLYSIEGIRKSHFVAPTVEEAASQAVSAGVDVDLGGDAFMNLSSAIRSGRVDESVIDTAVGRVLRMKFEMGLFEHPYVNPKAAGKIVRNKEHVRLARKVAQSSVVLLKNKNSILPLSKNIKRVAVVGPNADNRYNMLGDYTAPQENENVKTVLDGVLSKLPPAKVEYVRGCAIRDTVVNEIAKVIEAACRSEVVIAVVGGSSARDFKTNYKETGAAIADKKGISDMECGEGFDRATLTLLGRQQELLNALKATGKPLIVVYIEGRPLDKVWASEHADALLTAHYPGQEGGYAIADVLFGDYNPAGRLPVSVPRSVGQIPVYYNKKAPRNHDYVEMSASPLYPFGYGLSYSVFEYSNLKLRQQASYSFEVSFEVQNTGKCDGEEVAQLYIRDEYASVAQPLKQLKHFQRFFLRQGEKKKIMFSLGKDDLSIIDREMRRVVEPGNFQVMIGSSSDDIRLSTTIAVK